LKILLYSDNHWSQYSSIIRRRGDKYSVRLENQIKSLNWAMRLAEDNKCFATFCLGDFFDKADLNAEEISALKDIEWAGMSNYFIAGNHEMGIAGHQYSSSKLFSLLDTGYVFTQPEKLKFGGIEICILPYILECDRNPINEYFGDKPSDKHRLILSHNDIKGIQMGQFISQDGFDIADIESHCDLCINGHLHNGSKISDKIINIGNLTGQNFSEDASRYDHCAFIIDTDTLKVEVFENPYAFNFYKLSLNRKSKLNFKQHSIITAKVSESDEEFIKDKLSNDSNIDDFRVIVERSIKIVDTDDIEELTVDHLKTFYEYMINNFENTDILIKELEEIAR